MLTEEFALTFHDSTPGMSTFWKERIHTKLSKPTMVTAGSPRINNLVKLGEECNPDTKLS